MTLAGFLHAGVKSKPQICGKKNRKLRDLLENCFPSKNSFDDSRQKKSKSLDFSSENNPQDDTGLGITNKRVTILEKTHENYRKTLKLKLSELLQDSS